VTPCRRQYGFAGSTGCAAARLQVSATAPSPPRDDQQLVYEEVEAEQVDACLVVSPHAPLVKNAAEDPRFRPEGSIKGLHTYHTLTILQVDPNEKPWLRGFCRAL
jgi:hypothetical protein